MSRRGRYLRWLDRQEVVVVSSAAARQRRRDVQLRRIAAMREVYEGCLRRARATGVPG